MQIAIRIEDFTPEELKALSDMAKLKQLGIFTSKAIKAHLNIAPVAVKNSMITLRTQADIEAYMAEARKNRPELTNYTARLVQEGLEKRLKEGAILINKETGVIQITQQIEKEAPTTQEREGIT